METKLSVIKIGGNLIDNPKKLHAFLTDFSKLPQPKILVHGGGKIATSLSKKMGYKSELISGRRITTTEELQIITMVYAGLINKNIVAILQSLNCNAIGLSGVDGNSISARIRQKKPIDFGWVGDIEKVQVKFIKNILNIELTPVFSAISHDTKGQLLNTNADTIASEIAIALSGFYNVELLYCFEKKGVLATLEDEDSVILEITPEKYEALKANGTIQDGMLPKMENCFYALQHNVSKVIIGSPEILNENHTQFTTLKR